MTNEQPPEKRTVRSVEFPEYAYQVKRTTCQSILDHEISWCGDCYACTDCGKIFIFAGVANQALQERERELVEKVKAEREILEKVLAKATMADTKEIYEEKIETCDEILALITTPNDQTKI